MRPWEMNIRRVVPYVPGDQPAGDKLIKLNTNENPYPPAPGVERALREMDADRLRKYPDPSSAELVTALAEYYGVGEDQVFVGVGSDDVIAMSFLTFFNSQRPVLFPDITYSFYKVWADLYRIPYEAYIDFAGPSARELLPGYDNLLVVQTFSKSRSMAGVRIGFALGSPALIKALNDVKYSYNSYTMNLPSQIAGTQAVKDRAYFEETRAKIMTTRERSKKRFAELGFTFPDSMTNFILVTHERVPARAIFDALKKEQIYVRYFNAPRLDNSLRVSIGTDEEMDVLFRFLEQYVKEWKPAGNSE